MKSLWIFLALLPCVLSTATAQVSSTQITFTEVKWTINLPDDFEVLSTKRAKKEMKKGVKILKKLNDTTEEHTNIQVLISAKKGLYNIFNSTINNEEIDDTTSARRLKDLKNIMFITFGKLIEQATLDSVSSTVFIGGIPFDKFEVNAVEDEKVVFTSCLLFKLYKGYQFAINYTYTDTEVKIQIETMLNNSRFAE